MKNKRRVLVLTVIMLFSMWCAVFASDEFVLKRELTYRNERDTQLKDGFVEIMIGQKNFTEYQEDGDITIKPAPDEIREDDYGNLCAYYDVSGYQPGRILKVEIQRKFKVYTFEKEVSVRSEATVDSENRIYVEEQTRVDSEDDDIIAKAKDITQGLSSDYKKALALFEYVNTEMEYTTASTYANKGSLSALKNEKGVCEEFATLYAALCRAIEIPCKVVEGYRYEKKLVKDSEIIFDNEIGQYVLTEPEYEYELLNHVWNEIWLDDYGWLPVDTCVIYAPQGTRLPYYDSFGAINTEEYIATGIYNYDKANRTMKGMQEVSFQEEMFLASDIVVDEHSFDDIGRYTWAEDAINTLYSMDVIQGYSDTEFGPGGNITRIEFIALLARVLRTLNYQSMNTGMVYYYLDYDRNHYSKEDYDYLMGCLENELPFDSFAKGYYAMYMIFGDSLQPTKPITRGEVVALLDPFLRYDSEDEMVFTDSQNHRFYQSILKAYSNGLVTGYEDGSFQPDGFITRAEIAVILDRYVGIKDYVI